MCVFYKCSEGFLQCPICRIQLILNLKLQVHSCMNRGELKLYVPQRNYNYSNVFSTRQLSRWFLGDDLWAPATISCQCHWDILQGWSNLPLAVARWVMFPATLKYPLSWLGHLLCQICILGVQSRSLLLITLYLFLSAGRCCQGLLWFFTLALTHHGLIKPGLKGRRCFG